MAIYRFQFSIPYFTNMPSDVVVNDWHFSWAIGSASESDFENARDRLITFYNSCYTVTGDSFMAPWMVPGDASVKVYNINDPIPRAPVYESLAAITNTPEATGVMPLETAICCSFQGDPLSGVPQARRRGRVFLGGWNLAITPGDNNEFPIVSSTLTTAIAAAAAALGTGLTADGWIWVVYSRVNGTGAAVTNGWVDNALDTQRRREVGATARVTFP